MSAADLIRDARERHGLTQARLARRARTTQKHVSRIERGEVSPSVEMLDRLLVVMGERLEMRAEPLPRSNPTTRELRDDFESLTLEQRLEQGFELSEFATSIAGAAQPP